MPGIRPARELVKTKGAEELGYHSIWLTDRVALKENSQFLVSLPDEGRWDYA
jgi:hypothetical protein